MLKDSIKSSTWYDFFGRRKFLLFAVGFLRGDETQSTSLARRVTIFLAACCMVVLWTLTIITVAKSVGNKILLLETLYVQSLLFVTTFHWSNRHLNDGNLNMIASMLRKGFYSYTDGALDEEIAAIRRKNVEYIEFSVKWFSSLMSTTGVVYSVLAPICKYFLLNEEVFDKSINPHFPVPLYMPFDTTTWAGVTAGYSVALVCVAFVVAIVCSFDELFVSLVGQLKMELEILNFSLANIEKRAIAEFKRNNSQMNFTKDTSAFYNFASFQNCIYSCLRSNILHHQKILRFHKILHNYTGPTMQVVFIFTTFDMVSTCVLVLENPEIVTLAIYGVSFICELLFPLRFCGIGEEVITESTQLFHSVYNGPWFHCDKRYKALALVMLANTKEPIKINASYFRISASLDTFGTIISSFYQFVNVVRNAK